MDFEDLFGHDNHRRKRGHDHYENHDDRHRGAYDRDDRPHNASYGYNYHSRHDGLMKLSSLLPQLLANKKLLLTIGIVFLLAMALIAILILPLIGSIFDYINRNGLMGIFQWLLQGAGGQGGHPAANSLSL